MLCKILTFYLFLCYWLSTSSAAALPQDNAALYHRSTLSSIVARADDDPSDDEVPIIELPRIKNNNKFYIPLKEKNRFSMIEYNPKNLNPGDTSDNEFRDQVSAIYLGQKWPTKRLLGGTAGMQKLGSAKDVVVKIPVQREGSLLWQALYNSQDGPKFIMDVQLAKMEEGCDFVYRAVMPQYDSDLLDARIDGILTRNRLILMVADLTNQVEYMHSQGVYHRDLKPDNVFVNLKGRTKKDKARLKQLVEMRIGDYDFATKETRMSGEGAGTPMYMSQGKKKKKSVFSV